MRAPTNLLPKSSPYTLSRSWIRYRGWRPYAVASIACLQIITYFVEMSAPCNAT